MKLRRIGLYVALSLGAAACSSPITPAGTVTLTTAAPVSPANGAQIANAAQPVMLTVANALVTDTTAGVTYTFEIATDAGFANKVSTKDVSQTTGQTSIKLDTLPAGTDYFWRVQTKSAGTVGTFTTPLKFTIGPAIIIQPPGLVSPANGGASQTLRPTFTVSNAVRSGPVTTIAYRFDVATNAGFNPVLLSGTLPEGGGGQTSFTPSSDLGLAVTVFWRVQAIDNGSNITSAFSPSWSVTTPASVTRQSQLAAQQGLVLWPGSQPPGTTGKAILGDNWQVQTLVSFGGVRFSSPSLENLRLFDLFDRGLDPQAAIDWMRANGYPTDAAWYPSVQVIGVQYVYLALIGGRWDLILRAE